MITRTGEWDIRVSAALRRIVLQAQHGVFHSRGIRTNRQGAIAICKALARSYKIAPPVVTVNVALLRQHRSNAMYFPMQKAVVMYGTNHVKSIFHEFYHHLDYVTQRRYNSDDHYDFAWTFAEMVYAKIKEAA